MNEFGTVSESKTVTAHGIFNNNDGVRIDKEVAGKNVLVIDDLYQSGATIWKYASYLKSKGARKVYGLVCVKALRDSDNL